MQDIWTPAHQAAEDEDAAALAQLLAKGVDPDGVCGNMTVLMHAIDAEGDGAFQSGGPLTVHTTAVLLAFGADPQMPGPDLSLSRTWFSLHDVGTSVGNAFHSSATTPPFWTHRISSNEAGRRTPSSRSASSITASGNGG
ncbi:hypothetical protein [Streptomyces massasporeus]|uniref:hypothetical protein n=1 Tax=Streptomyces massasporeus TaxID=67324 RepID=UPI003F4C3F92